MKDPAFLFYSNDFYEGTRTMLPEERACYIDLLIYQHQNGSIPDDPKRLAMYCSGCSAKMVNQVLNQKFIKTDNGWVNQVMQKHTKNRSKYRPKKIASATLAGLISSSKNLTEKQKKEIKSNFRINDFTSENQPLDDNSVKKMVNEWFNQMVNQMVEQNDNQTVNKETVDHLVNNLENGNVIINNNTKEIDNNLNNNKENKFKSKQSINTNTREEILFPFNSENFKKHWQLWKDYKSEEHKFKFKSAKSEQAQLAKLEKLSNGNEQTAIVIINQSIENGWKGLFQLDNYHHKANHNETEKPKPLIGRMSAETVKRNLQGWEELNPFRNRE